MKHKFLLLLFAASALTLASCSNDPEEPHYFPPTEPHELTVLHVRSNESQTEIEVPEAAHFQSVAETDAEWIQVAFSAQKDKMTITTDTNLTGKERSAQVVIKDQKSDATIYTLPVRQSAVDILPGEILIKEIFFTSTEVGSTGRPDKYCGDQYFILTNNSKRSIDVTGLMIMEGKINSMQDLTFPNDIRPTHMPVQTVYCIPENGDKNRLNPGDELVIANNATDHTKTNPKSIDLSQANYEWFDVSSNAIKDTDYPAPNLDIWYTYSLSIWTLYNRGCQGYAIAMPPANMDKDTFLTNYKWEGKYTMHTDKGDFSMEISKAYKVPNEWVLDAVNLAIPSTMKMLSFDKSQDAGYSYCGSIDNDPERFGKSVRRKTAEDGVTLIDTNNSTEDFLPNSKPSLAQ